MEECDELIANAKDVLDLNSYHAWKTRCDLCLQSMRERCRTKVIRRNSRSNTGVTIALVLRITRLEGVKYNLRHQFECAEGSGLGAGTSSGGGGGGGGGDIAGGFSWVEIETAFTNRVLTGVVMNSTYIDPIRFLEDIKDTVLSKVRDNLERHTCLKVNVVFNGEFTANQKIDVKSIATKNEQLFGGSDLDEWYDWYVLEKILCEMEEFQERDSGWALLRILNLIVNVNKCNPMRVGCWVDLPRAIQNKRAVINIRCEDYTCFPRAVVAGLYPAKRNPDRCLSYPDYNIVLNMDGITLPVNMKCISKFERQNNISINVFTTRDGVENDKYGRDDSDNKIVPLRLTNNKMDKHVNLLYLRSSQSDVNWGHFVFIKSLSRLVSRQLASSTSMKYICDRCLHYFYSSDRLARHSIDCSKMNDCAIILPAEHEKTLSFVNNDRKERVPFVVYADLECILKKDLENSFKTRNNYAYQQHIPFSLGYYLHCDHDESLSRYRFRRSEDCVSWFVEELREIAHRAKEIYSILETAVFTLDEECDFWTATHCHICENPFRVDERRVRDHCHITGRYRGPAHNRCNLNYRKSYTIPVFFHNLMGYDAHFIIERIANAFEGKIELLPLTKENYISFTKTVLETQTPNVLYGRCVKFRFVDSFKFLNSNLQKLASYLDTDKLRITLSQYPELLREDLELLTRKGVFPYEYIDSVDKLAETELPPRDVFYSSLTDETASVSDYEHALTVWHRFHVNDIGEYSDLYLKTDVLLLADIFENFRDSCVKSYGLDPAHYYTLPGYTWDAMLRHTGVRFELLTDVDMVLFIERGIRGGLSQCSHRYARANNPYLSTFDSSMESSYLMYYDVNNLYGWAMCESLPHGNFRWLEEREIENFDVTTITLDSPIGYILEVDLEYPRHLHDVHADLPLCPNREKPPGKRLNKLLATVEDKTRYVTHYRNLQQCLRLGLRLTRIHRILQFAQSPWLKSYIDMNTAFRTLANNEFERNLYKLMNNAVFGKTMENVRNHVDVRLVTEWDGRFGAEAMISMPNFHSRSVFSENLVAIELRKVEVMINRPIYVGMCILEISKTLLYDFHYEFMVPHYGKLCTILYTDTDSLIYHLTCSNAYEYMRLNLDKFDTSDYPEANVYNLPRVNKKVPGLMKDENNGQIMTEFVGLRAKMYAYKVLGCDDTKKIKGVKNTVTKKLTFDDYVTCLREMREFKSRQSCIRSRLHEVYTTSEQKLALSPYDDKRYLIEGTEATLPWGHYKITL